MNDRTHPGVEAAIVVLGPAMLVAAWVSGCAPRTTGVVPAGAGAGAGQQHDAGAPGTQGTVAAPVMAVQPPIAPVAATATVLSYERGAMEDLHEDGSWSTYDAVTIRLLAPSELADGVFILYDEASSPSQGPWRQVGTCLGFTIDPSLLEPGKVLFTGAAGEPATCACEPTGAGGEPAPPLRR